MLHEKHKAWIEARSLDPVLAEKLGISTKRDGGAYWLSVPYVENGKTVNHKYRLTSEKRHRMDAGAPLCLWNQDVLLDAPDGATVIITEGEWDAIAAMMAGQKFVLSVPNGGSCKQTDGPIDPETDSMKYLWRARGLLDRAGSFVLATDSDETGTILASELARRLGPERCRFVEYPTGVGGKPMKDLNEVLTMWGVDTVRDIIEAARPYPIQGLYKLSDFPRRRPLEVIPIGIPGLTDLINIVRGTLTVLTGFAGQGKTSLTMAIVANLLKRRIPTTLGTFETFPDIIERRLRAAILECNEYALPVPRLAEADALIDAYLTTISQRVGEDREMTLEDVLELARVSVLRDGCQVLIIDPWNEMEHKRRRDETETEYANRAIRAWRHFCQTYNVAGWIVAHPAKPDMSAKVPVPGLYHVSGSAAWANKPDYGLSYTRPDKKTNIARIYVSKVKMGLPGKEGDVELAYNWPTSSYILPERAETTSSGPHQ
jgi:twinkle protein